jgi:hypothetical protein
MPKPSTFAKVALAAVTGVMALSAGAASAQPYGGGAYGDSYYDPCRRDSNNRGIVGALLGAGIGATVGSQLAARGHRTDGSVLGGALGAFGGAAVGSNSAACRPGYVQRPYRDGPPPPPPVAYNETYAPPPYARDGYAAGYERNRYDRDDAYAYGRRGERFRVVEERRAGPDGCTLAESPIHMPDGRTQMRFVRVCLDSSGRYQVVD